MKRWYYLIGGLILLLSLYHCYRLCNRDTKIIQGKNRICIPDSSWLSAAIDLRSIRNEIAWNTFLSGNIQSLFKSDSNTNTFLQILKSPSDFNIQEQDPVYYFSKWNNDIQHHGFILSLQHSKNIRGRIGGTPAASIGQGVYTAHTKEGFWIYNEQQVLFLFSEQNDSICAVSYFLQEPLQPHSFILSDSVRIAVLLETKYIPQKHCSQILDSTRISIQLSTKGKSLQASWIYQGPFEHFVENTELTEPVNHSGLYYTARHSSSLLDIIQGISPDIDSIYLHNKECADHLLKTLEENTIQASFSGWDQIRSSYYISEMNDEFETVLRKKDTSFKEPVFQIYMEQRDAKHGDALISYLQHQGLIALQKKGIYEIIPGNFDSDLILQQDHSLLLKNKHNQQKYNYTNPIYAAFLLDLTTNSIDRWDIPVAYSNILTILNTMEHARMQGIQTQEGMKGNLTITYKESDFPLIQVLKNISELRH